MREAWDDYDNRGYRAGRARDRIRLGRYPVLVARRCLYKSDAWHLTPLDLQSCKLKVATWD